MSFRQIFSPTLRVAAVIAPMLACAPAHALGSCEVGDLCTIQTALFGCKDASLIKQWIDTYVDQDRQAADNFIAKQVDAGQCAQFKAGDKLRIVRYLGMRRLMVSRPGQTERFILLLK